MQHWTRLKRMMKVKKCFTQIRCNADFHWPSQTIPWNMKKLIQIAQRSQFKHHTGFWFRKGYCQVRKYARMGKKRKRMIDKEFTEKYMFLKMEQFLDHHDLPIQIGFQNFTIRPFTNHST